MAVRLARVPAVALAFALTLASGVTTVGASPVVVHTQPRNMGATAGVAGGTAQLAVRFAGLPAGHAVTFRFAGQERTGSTDATGYVGMQVELPTTPSSVTWTARFGGTQSSTSVSYAAAEHSGTFAVTSHALRLSLPAQTRSGTSVNVTVTALGAGGQVDEAATGAPALSTTDTHASAATCGSYRSGAAECTGLVLRDLGRQVVTAVDEHARGGAEGGAVTVSPAAVTLLAYERQVSVGTPAEFLVEPRAAGEGLAGGYLAVSTVRASTEEQASAPCAGSGCRIRLTFDSTGSRDVVGVEGQSGLVSEPVRVDVTQAPHRDCESGARITLDRAAIVAGEPVGLTVRERPGTTVDLYGYTRPSTTYRLLRTGVTDAGGVARFTVRPPANTRLRAQQREEDCESAVATAPTAVLDVSTALTLGATRDGVRSYTFAGGSFPVRAGGLVVSLYRVTADGGHVLTAQARASATTGRWVVRRVFSGTGRFGFVARTGRDVQNAPGSSGIRSTLVY